MGLFNRKKKEVEIDFDSIESNKRQYYKTYSQRIKFCTRDKNKHESITQELNLFFELLASRSHIKKQRTGLLRQHIRRLLKDNDLITNNDFKIHLRQHYKDLYLHDSDKMKFKVLIADEIKEYVSLDELIIKSMQTLIIKYCKSYNIDYSYYDKLFKLIGDNYSSQPNYVKEQSIIYLNEIQTKIFDFNLNVFSNYINTKTTYEYYTKYYSKEIKLCDNEQI